MTGYFLGGVLKILVMLSTGGTQAMRLEHIINRASAVYCELDSGSRFSEITIDIFGGRGKDFPYLKGKAIENKRFVPVLALIWKELRGDSCEAVDKHVDAAFYQLDRLYKAYDAGGLFLTRAEAKDMLDAGTKFSLHYNFASKHYLGIGIGVFNMPPKMHVLQHILKEAFYLSPRATSCYRFEDFIGRIVRVAGSCVTGTPMRLVGPKTLDNYRIALGVKWSE